MIHLFYKYQGREIHDQACIHALMLAEKAKGFTIHPDLDVGDTWTCNICETGVNMIKLVEVVKNNFKGVRGIRVVASSDVDFPTVLCDIDREPHGN